MPATAKDASLGVTVMTGLDYIYHYTGSNAFWLMLKKIRVTQAV